MQEQWVAVGRSRLEVPAFVQEEVLVLRVDAEVRVVGDVHGLRGVTPGVDLGTCHAELPRYVLVPGGAVGGASQIRLRHQVGVDVVVHQGGVLVWPGDAVDAERTVGAEVTQCRPQPGRLHQQLNAAGALELSVSRRQHVATHGVGDGGVDVEGGHAGGPVTGALLAADGAPRESGALQAELAGTVTGKVER